MSSSAVKLFIFISCFLVAVRIVSGVASSAKLGRRKLEKPPEKGFDLDMAPNSVDDQFKGCAKQAEHVVLKKYLPQELNSNPEFNAIWQQNGWLNIYDRSIRVYTASSGVYNQFNNKMSSGRKTYRSWWNPFPFKALHFLLTRAVQTRKIQQCRTVYRRTTVSFKPIAKNRKVRFGRFASTSIYPNLVQFGSNACFEMKTCFGADISQVSYYQSEGEVLIPPYETFQVTDIRKKNKLKCKVLYRLKSVGTFSKMNCEILKKVQVDTL